MRSFWFRLYGFATRSLASRPAADEAPHRTREKPLVPSVLHLKHGGRRVFS